MTVQELQIMKLFLDYLYSNNRDLSQSQRADLRVCQAVVNRDLKLKTMDPRKGGEEQ